MNESRQLLDLVSVGKATLADFQELGITQVEQLVGQDPRELILGWKVSRKQDLIPAAKMSSAPPSPRPKTQIYLKKNASGITGHGFVRKRSIDNRTDRVKQTFCIVVLAFIPFRCAGS